MDKDKEPIFRIDRLRTIREQRGVSQRELARLCKLAETLVFKYESGISAPNVESLKLMAENLEVSTDYLLGITDDPRGHFGDGIVNDEEKIMLDTFRREGWPGVIRLGAGKITR